MRIYVASAFANKAEVRDLQKLLRMDGHVITHDWTTEDASHLVPGSFEWHEFLQDCGDADLQGVIEADALVLIAHPEMRDTRFEAGVAVGMGIPVYVLNAHRAVSVFYRNMRRVSSADALLAQISDSEEQP